MKPSGLLLNCLLIFRCYIECCPTKIIQTISGPVIGKTTTTSKKYLGIPYATAKRFESPEPPAPWTEPLTATSVGPMCYQDCPSSPPHLCLQHMSEDCLTLNIWVPRGTPPESGFPVMLFIHGGNFVSYGGGVPLFDGDRFVYQGGVILVTINYRLGAFGFLPQVENGSVVSGNLGLRDQEMGIKWVSDNIAAFGGDKSKVTLFGQSCGAQSVVIHLASPNMAPYFERAIIQSLPLTLPFRNPVEAESQASLFWNELGCEHFDEQCLNAKTSEEILSAQRNTPNDYSGKMLMTFQPWGPVVDGTYITGNLTFMAKNLQQKDIIIGTTRDEGVIYIYSMLTGPLPNMFFQISLAQLLPDSSAVAQEYNVGHDARGALAEVTTDFVFYCPSRKFAESVSQKANVWFYMFDQPLFIDAWGDVTFCRNRSCHGIDMPFLFDTPYLFGYEVTQDDHKLSTAMIDYWTNFAKYGNPNNGTELVNWPKFDGTTSDTMLLTEPSVEVYRPTKGAKCQAIENQGFRVTLFGQSCGAQSVVIHLASQNMAPYFERAIIQSLPLTLPFRNPVEAESQASLFWNELGCEHFDEQCLNAKTSEEILSAQRNTPNDYSGKMLMTFQPWGPVVDGTYITGNLTFMAKNLQQKDIIIGTTRDEGVIYIYSMLTGPLPNMFFQISLAQLLPDSSAVAQEYNVGHDARGALAEVTTDFVFYCPSLKFAESASQKANVWFYMFDQPLFIDAWGDVTFCRNRSCHGIDMPFLFDTPYLFGYEVTQDDHKLSTAMIDYWTNFAKYGNPNNGTELVNWPKFDGTTSDTMLLTEPSVEVYRPTRGAKCQAIENQGFRVTG